MPASQLERVSRSTITKTPTSAKTCRSASKTLPVAKVLNPVR